MQDTITKLFDEIGIKADKRFQTQLGRAELIELAVRDGEGELSDNGALNILTGEFTGRSPKDRYIVKDQFTSDSVDWNATNQPVDTSVFNTVRDLVVEYLNSRDSIYLREASVGSFDKYALNCTFLSEKASQDLFISNMFIDGVEDDSVNDDWLILVASELTVDDYVSLGLNAKNCVLLDFTQKTILVVGTGYTGEIKKGMFSAMNFLLPHKHNVLSMHCSANVGKDGDTALFFGLSGTGKTTLSTDRGRFLIGDDEHGWSDEGVFNFEGGCYAKCIGLTAENEPEIYGAVRFGALTENIIFHKGTREADYEDKSVTENIRVSYPLSFIPDTVSENLSNAPKNIFFLTADAFGILPPLSRLTIEQAMYYFVNGYTAKVAGTEVGVLHPVATFSACFGQAFLPLHPMQYANMLRDRLQADDSINVWLVNTGWIGGPYGVGRRISLTYTRRLLRAALNDEFEDVLFNNDNAFGLSIPESCPQVPSDILNPRALWENKDAYDIKAKELKVLFEENYKKYSITDVLV